MLPCIRREREAQWLPSLRRTMVHIVAGAAGRGLNSMRAPRRGESGTSLRPNQGSSLPSARPPHMTKSAMAVSSEARVTEAPMAVRAGTVNRTVTGSSPVAGAIESLGSPRLFYFHRIGGQTRHPIINREIHGEDLTTTHIRQTGHCQFTDERHGIPSISLGIPRKSYIETLVRGMAESIGKSGALGATPLRPGSRRAWRPWHRCRCTV